MIVQIHFRLCEDFGFMRENSNNLRCCYDVSLLLEVVQVKNCDWLKHIAPAGVIVVIVPSGAVKHKNDREFYCPVSLC